MTIAFVSCIFLGNRSGSESSICSRRRSPRASAEQPGSDQNWSGNNWTISGKTFESQQEQTIEFVIRPGGLVEETVTGVRGEACEKLTEKIENALGKVVHKEKTTEYYDGVYEQVIEDVTEYTENKW